MLYRKAQDKILNWYKNDNKALLITGARQVGKSYIIRETLKKENIDFLEINFINQPELVETIQSLINQNSEELSRIFSVLAGHNLEKEKAVIFFDEVQECKEIVTAIKFLVEKNDYKYILSGSLLGIELNNLRSAPVGYLETYRMFPMDLEEFYISCGVSQKVLSEIKNCFENKKPINEAMHYLLMSTFYKYLVVGGMPEAVQAFVNNKDYFQISEIHEAIKNQYLLDFTKYENNKANKLYLKNIYELIPPQLNQENKRYLLQNVDPNARFNKYENSFNWLIEAGIVLPLYNVTNPKIPLSINKKSNLFKLFLSDIGMLSTSYGKNTILNILAKDKDINYGAPFENFVTQELTSKSVPIYYYSNRQKGEVDFIIERKGKVLPIEIKSGKDYSRHSALNNLISNKEYKIDEAYVFTTQNVEVKDKITYYPIYMLMFLNDQNIKLPKNEKHQDLGVLDQYL